MSRIDGYIAEEAQSKFNRESAEKAIKASQEITRQLMPCENCENKEICKYAYSLFIVPTDYNREIFNIEIKCKLFKK